MLTPKLAFMLLVGTLFVGSSDEEGPSGERAPMLNIGTKRQVGNHVSNKDVNSSAQSRPICQVLHSIPSDVKSPLVSLVFSLILNIMSALFTGLLNLVVLVALTRRERLRTASNLILTSMAISDLLVGFLVQPLKVTYKLLHMFDSTYHSFECLAAYIGLLCVCASLLNIIFFSGDRFFATVLPYRYLEHLIYTKYLAVILSMWLVLFLASILTFFGVLPSHMLVEAIIWLVVLCFLLVTASYSTIYCAVRKQQRKTAFAQSLFLSRNRDIGESSAVFKSTEDLACTMRSNLSRAGTHSFEPRELGNGRVDWNSKGQTGFERKECNTDLGKRNKAPAAVSYEGGVLGHTRASLELLHTNLSRQGDSERPVENKIEVKAMVHSKTTYLVNKMTDFKGHTPPVMPKEESSLLSAQHHLVLHTSIASDAPKYFYTNDVTRRKTASETASPKQCSIKRETSPSSSQPQLASVKSEAPKDHSCNNAIHSTKECDANVFSEKHSTAGVSGTSTAHILVLEVSPSDEIRPDKGRRIPSIQRLSMLEKGRTASKSNTRNRTVLMLIAAFMLCYMPTTVMKIVQRWQNFSESTWIVVLDWTNNIVLLNSAINPVIYCWRVSSLRKEMMSSLRAILNYS